MSDTPPEPAAPTSVVQFPHDVSEEERNRRIMVEAARLANQPPGEWKLWAPRSAERLGIEPKLFAELIEAKIEDREQRKREAQAEARLGEERAKNLRLGERDRQREQQRIDDAAKKKAKEKSKAFADIIKLPSDQHEAKLAELGKKLDVDVASLSEEFAEYCAAEAPSSSSVTMSEGDIEPWPEPVTTAVVLEELIARIHQHIKAKPYEVLAIALWVLMAWVHEVAAHYSVYLVATSPDTGMGKTTLIVDVVSRLVPKPYVSGSDPTVASIFRTADREKPTMIFDNVDTLFQRKPEVAELFLNGWTRGIKVPRSERINGEWQTVWYDPFCPKACSLIGANLPSALLGRCLLIELWPLKPGEKVDKVSPFDQELMDGFKTLRRKLARWSNDNAVGLRSAKPLLPAAFISRPADNWTLLWAIAELAGSDWAEQARAAAERLSQDMLVEPSWLKRLLQVLWVIFVNEGHTNIVSKQLLVRLTADPTSEWCDYSSPSNPRGHRITEREVAALLRIKLHIRPHPIGKTRVRGYHRQDFLEKEIFQHFLGHDPLIRSPDTQPKKKTRKSRRKQASG